MHTTCTNDTQAVVQNIRGGGGDCKNDKSVGGSHRETYGILRVVPVINYPNVASRLDFPCRV